MENNTAESALRFNTRCVDANAMKLSPVMKLTGIYRHGCSSQGSAATRDESGQKRQQAGIGGASESGHTAENMGISANQWHRGDGIRSGAPAVTSVT
ncbi:hypothetical protein [Stenotrophomonas indicatrix]|uniref:hypothetical protein n=1 Tax=Stenotrophomonas indicatrix TaxID=2045451 RepID=UPI0013FD1AED|nr:hypothetical protein [Stenotrophomonas indicatrix]